MQYIFMQGRHRQVLQTKFSARLSNSISAALKNPLRELKRVFHLYTERLRFLFFFVHNFLDVLAVTFVEVDFEFYVGDYLESHGLFEMGAEVAGFALEEDESILFSVFRNGGKEDGHLAVVGRNGNVRNRNERVSICFETDKVSNGWLQVCRDTRLARVWFLWCHIPTKQRTR